MYELQGEKKDSVHFGTVADSGSGCSSMHSDDDRSGNIVDRNDTRYLVIEFCCRYIEKSIKK